MMETFLIKTVPDAKQALDRITKEGLCEARLQLHEDLFNVALRKTLTEAMTGKKVRGFEVRFENGSLIVGIDAAFAGGVTLTYFVRVTQAIFRPDRHALTLSYVEDVQTRSGLLGGLLGGMKNQTRASVLQMVTKNLDFVHVEAGAVHVDLDRWDGFAALINDTKYQGKSLRECLTVKDVRLQDHCLTFDGFVNRMCEV